MKNLHNVLSDAFEAANLLEQEYNVTVNSLTSRRIYVHISKIGTNLAININLSLDSDGFLRSVHASENTLLPVTERAYSAFLDAIYSEEFIYV